MDKISSIKERVLQYLNNQGITKVEFCNKTDISYSNLKGKSLESEFGGEQIAKIFDHFSRFKSRLVIAWQGLNFARKRQNFVGKWRKFCCFGKNLSGNFGRK